MNKKLAKEILDRVRADQRMRRQFIAGKMKWNKQIDRKNTQWLKKITERHGWPTISLVGSKASRGAWLLVQHADHDLRFQKKVLKILNETHEKNKRDLNPENIAYLIDRVLVHEKKQQVFGTQFRRKNEKAKFEPLPIKDRRNINKRRKAYGLPTIEENTNRINEEYKRLYWK